MGGSLLIEKTVMKDDSEPLFKTIEKNEDKEVILNTWTGETYTIYKKEEEERLAEIRARGRDLEETLLLIEKYFGKKKQYSGKKKR